MDGELTPEEEKQLGEHLAFCADCRQFQQELISLKGVMATAIGAKLPIQTEQDIAQKTVGKIPLIKRLFEGLGGYYRVPRGAAWAAIIVILVLLANSLGFRVRTGSRAEVTQEFFSGSASIQRIELTKADLVEVHAVSLKDLKQ